MRNRLIDLSFPLLALLLLVSYPMPLTHTESAASEILSSQRTACFAESLDSGDHEPSGYSPDPFNHPGHFYYAVSNNSLTAPDDKYFSKQWRLTKVSSLKPRQTTSYGKDILIAVLDTGIDLTHEDLSGKVAASVNFSDSPISCDSHGHGTHIAGIIAATANNGTGIANVAPDLRLLNVKVTDDSSMVCPATIAKCIEWAVDNGADVINMSFTLSEPTQAMEIAVDYAWNKGVVVLAAAGNYTGNGPVYPACYSNCIAVTATNADSSTVSWANHGDWVDVAAPGISIYSTLPNNGYGYKSGTSMATAYVAGIAGLLFSAVHDTNNNGLLNDEVRYLIENGCDELGIIDIGKRHTNTQEVSARLWQTAQHGEHANTFTEARHKRGTCIKQSQTQEGIQLNYAHGTSKDSLSSSAKNNHYD